MSTSTTAPKRNVAQRTVASINTFQINHQPFGFLYAVVKKYGDDNGGYLAALLTYYGFLSLFPLLLVATSVANIIAQHNTGVREKLLSGFNTYFPVVGNQLQASVHSSSKTGIALVIGLLITLYGAKGIADAVQHALNYMWQIPRTEQPGFPTSTLISIALLAGGGIGLSATVILSSVATTRDHSAVLAILSTGISMVILFAIFSFLMVVGVSARYTFKDMMPGAILATIGIQVLETIGGYLITHQLHNLQGVYGQFALVLAILFWLYIQAEIFLYAVACNTVYTRKLWPRSLLAANRTKADERAVRLSAQKEQLYRTPTEKIDVKLRK